MNTDNCLSKRIEKKSMNNTSINIENLNITVGPKGIKLTINGKKKYNIFINIYNKHKALDVKE